MNFEYSKITSLSEKIVKEYGTDYDKIFRELKIWNLLKICFPAPSLFSQSSFAHLLFRLCWAEEKYL